MPLTVRVRPGKQGFWIAGTIAGVRIRRRAQGSSKAIAEEEAAIIEAATLRAAWHGKRPGHRTFGQAALSYLAHERRSAGDKARITRILIAAGDVALHHMDQEFADGLRKRMLRPDAAPGTVRRELMVPLRAILTHAARRKWCDMPVFDIPAESKGRTTIMLPAEFDALHAAAAPHLRPLLTFLIGVGARLGETLALDWRDVDLTGARARFWPDQTKSGQAYAKALPPAVVAALAGLPHRDGAVFRTDTGRPYAAREAGGGQIKTGWRLAMQRAGLAGFTPHTLRHSFASYHYALHRDLLALKAAGHWSSVALVERYAHLMPAGHEDAIRRIWGVIETTARFGNAAARA